MGKNQKHIITGKVAQWRRRDRRAIWIIPLSLGMLLSLTPIIMENSEITATPILPIPLMWYMASVLGLVIYFTISRNSRKTITQNATFNVTEDIDYYREKLSGLSPATISMLMDLEIEPDKDITASLLRFTLLGILSPDGEVQSTPGPRPSLTESDRLLLRAAQRGSMTIKEKLEWKSKAEDECVNGEYFERRTQMEITKSKGNGYLIAFLRFALMSIIVQLLIHVFHFDDAFNFFTAMAEEGAAISSADPILLIKTFILINVLLASIIWPYSTQFRSLAIHDNTKSFKRTFSGHAAAEKIAGMKNFLHDFSNLSEADKNQLILWDDFLVYAVVLEENSQIVQELLHRKNLSLKLLRF